MFRTFTGNIGVYLTFLLYLNNQFSSLLAFIFYPSNNEKENVYYLLKNYKIMHHNYVLKAIVIRTVAL